MSQNAEEASTIVSEFISSLDNIPNEVGFLLREIKIKDTRCQELHQEIHKDQTNYVKGSLAAASGLGAIDASNLAQGSSRIASHYNELSELSSEKIALAEQLIKLITRTKARLDADVARVKVLQGDSDDSRYSSRSSTKRANTYSGDNYRQVTPMLDFGDSILLEPPYKKRLSTTASSTPVRSSPVPTSLPSIALSEVYADKKKIPTRAASTRSRYREMFNAVINDDQLDAEGDDDPDADGEGELEDEEDSKLYCLCQRTSFGDMIGCDNPKCRYQWFHLSCVGVKAPLPDKWYCPDCLQARVGLDGAAADTLSILGGLQGDGRKRGRK